MTSAIIPLFYHRKRIEEPVSRALPPPLMMIVDGWGLPVTTLPLVAVPVATAQPAPQVVETATVEVPTPVPAVGQNAPEGQNVPAGRNVPKVAVGQNNPADPGSVRATSVPEPPIATTEPAQQPAGPAAVSKVPAALQPAAPTVTV